MRCRSIRWKPSKWPQRWSRFRALYWLQSQGADTSKCVFDYDWWEVEWPTPSGTGEA